MQTEDKLRRIVMLVVVLALGLAPAAVSTNSSGPQILILVLVPVVFIGSFVLLRLLPLRNGAAKLPTAYLLAPIIAVALIYALLWSYDRERLLRILNMQGNPWLFIIYLLLIFAGGLLVKQLFVHGRQK